MTSSMATSQPQALGLGTLPCLQSHNPGINSVHSNTSSNADDETDGQNYREDITSKIAFGASRSIKDFVSEMTEAYTEYTERQNEMLEEQMDLFKKNMAEQAERNNAELKNKLEEIFSNFDKRLICALDQVNLCVYFLSNKILQSKKKKRPRKSIDARRQSDSSEEAFRADQARKAESHQNQSKDSSATIYCSLWNFSSKFDARTSAKYSSSGKFHAGLALNESNSPTSRSLHRAKHCSISNSSESRFSVFLTNAA